MTMSRMQLNSKFVNNMLPEWGRFVIAVKLNKRLRDSNYDQLYAYLKQQEAHANENKMMLDRFTQHTMDPLALMSNVSHSQHYSQSSSTLPSTYVPPPLLTMLTLIRDLAFNVDKVFQSDDCDAFDSNVDEAPTAQTMFMANLSSADPVYDEASPSYDSDILCGVIVNGYYGMPMDPLDPYVQLIMEAPPSPDYIPGPEAPPSPDYIPELEYPEYLPPADDESSDSEEEEEEHLALTVPASALYSSVSASEETEPLRKARLQLHHHHLDTVLLLGYLFNHIYLCHFVWNQSKSIIEADIPLQKRARFTTPTGGYKVGESSVAAVARQISPALTIADRCRADDRLISRLRRERRYFRTLSTTYAQEVSHSRDYCTQIMDYCQSREVYTSTLVTQMEALQRDVSTLQRHHIDDEDRQTRHIQHEHA
nr:integrase, catalytic region, zinc finger, CCHC-type, peptidase aspartic, catalytic [Tanacetum cinerariifolium]